MKKVLSLLVLSAIVCLSVSACGTPPAIRRGSWNNLVYFNETANLISAQTSCLSVIPIERSKKIWDSFTQRTDGF